MDTHADVDSGKLVYAGSAFNTISAGVGNVRTNSPIVYFFVY
jgi:hypothetical protein